MTISYVQASNPYWYFSDLTGKSAGAGTVYFYSSLDPDILKTVYQDPAGMIPYPNPININLNGTVPPIYFQVDSTGALGNYDIFAYDAQGNLIEQINNFTPPGGSGGGGGTTNINLENLIVNNVMYRNTGSAAITPASGVNILAPGVHQGLATTPSNFPPDIIYYKNNGSATETISFPAFTLGLLPMSPSDITPYDYFQLSCTNPGSAESAKYVQFPLTNKVQNLSDTTVSGTIWGACTSGNTSLTISAVQFFGDGSLASNPTSTGATVITPLASFTLTSTWTQYNFSTATLPSVAGGTLGQCGNDGLFIQVGLPLNAATVMQFTKPCLYLGTTFTVQNYINYDQISGVVEAPRTGDIRVTLNSFAPFGWVAMNDGSIGSASSSATSFAGLSAFALYNLLWNNVGVTYAPMVDAAPYGASAVADFSANRAMYLTKQLGRLIAQHGVPSSGSNTGTNWHIGQSTGGELVTIGVNNLPAHSHPAASGGNFVNNVSNVNVYTPGNAGTLSNATGDNATTNAPLNVQAPVSYYNVFMKL